jgi:hypothetical protein
MPQRPEEEVAMTRWYAAHVIMAVELKDTVQESFPVWENIILIEAASEEEAFEKAERYGRNEEGDDGGSFRWGKKPARWVFAGVRKLTECLSMTDRPGDETELTYNELELDSMQAVKALAAGKRVRVSYNDRFRAPSKKRQEPEGGSKPGKRKRA